jgi:hypothetical protein
MKITQFFYKLLLPVVVLTITMGCDSDDDAEVYTDFASIASTYNEASGTGVITIPFRNAGSNLNSLNVTFAGSATEGTDFELVGITAEGVQIRVFDDNTLEASETVRITLRSAGANLAGNAIHTLTILSNCEDLEGLQLSDFAGDFHATEKYGPASSDWYGPYDLELVQDEEDPTIFWMDNFYDSGREAFIVVDLANGTVHFPDQTPLPDNTPDLLSESSGTFGYCTVEGHLVLTISLNYDGGDWEFELVKD